MTAGPSGVNETLSERCFRPSSCLKTSQNRKLAFQENRVSQLGGACPSFDPIENKSFVVGTDGPFAASEGPHDPEITLLKLAGGVVRQPEDV